MKGYEKLDVYNRAFEMALKLHEFSKTLPKIEQYSLADQIRRSSMSICANIAEGHGKSHFSVPEFRRFLIIACGSCEEIKVWLNFCARLNYIDSERFEAWHEEYDQIAKMLNGLIRKISS
ncbi:MAG TPA: four helix bundle protein [Alphaproteobacteria bacterium]|nr:four helix bundle protein [Alphaproteobacteria bacterium]